MKFYSNASMEPINGGYRIRTEEIDNSTVASGETSPEKGQYITFDMYLKNTSNTLGADPAGASITNGEAVYLLSDSNVNTSKHENGEVLEDNSDADGLENSVRVGFYQLGYVPLNANAETIGNLRFFTCSDSVSGINTLCDSSVTSAGKGISWNIWEPNDLDHETKAINSFARKCKVRTGPSSYNTLTSCSAISDAVTNGTALNTYAINSVIAISDNVNIYDGLNGYNGSYTNGNTYLKELANFTESDNLLDTDDPSNPYNTDRLPIIRLLPNAITKVRVYIWLEGQDPDNLDYNTASKNLLISFGFTKDMYEEELVDNRPTPSVSPSASTEPSPSPSTSTEPDPEQGG